MTFDEFLETAWTDHGDHPEEVADRLTASLHRLQEPQHIAPFARLLTHVLGEHLGQWRRGVELLRSLRSVPAFDGSAAVAGVLNRHVATLCYADGEGAALEALCVHDRVGALATAASAFAGRNEFKRAIAAYSAALQLAPAPLPSGSTAVRALAVGGNNLAAALEEKQDRDDAETQAMIAAAQGALAYWKQAGTWLEEERAYYRLARSWLQAGNSAAAMQSSLRCLEICELHGAPALEQFFGLAALALAHRAAGASDSFAAALERASCAYGKVPEAEQPSCAAQLQALRELAPCASRDAPSQSA